MTGPTGDGTRQTGEAILDGGCTFPLVIDVATYAKLAFELGNIFMMWEGTTRRTGR
jgi:hypothetical protein